MIKKTILEEPLFPYYYLKISNKNNESLGICLYSFGYILGSFTNKLEVDKTDWKCFKKKDFGKMLDLHNKLEKKYEKSN